MNEKFKQDYKRLVGKEWSILGTARLFKNHALQYQYLGRKSETARSKWMRHFFCGSKNHCGKKNGLEMEFSYIGGGLILTHPFGITINPGAVIGENATIFKGVTVGSVRSGKRAGVPRIGNRVTLCCNAFVCGNICIGNDVLIAANAYVNFDVPDHSIVIGNPGVIKHKENPSANYLNMDRI